MPLDHRTTPLGLAAVLALTLTVGCGGSPKPQAAVAEAAPVTEEIDRGASFYESEIGGMNEAGVEDTFQALARPIGRCFEQASARVEQIGGSFTVSFRVDRKGHTRWAYLKTSTIGDRATEACILDLVRSRPWPKPLSGEGLAEKTIDIEPSTAPHVLDQKRVRGVARLAKTRTAACRRGVRGTFLTTAYLEPDGRVRTAGVATPDEKTESVADCIASEVQKLRFGGTGKLSKVTFEI
ncbi:MAG: hypothetical protein R3B70_15180 [Polyangiaceae bacterium]